MHLLLFSKLFIESIKWMPIPYIEVHVLFFIILLDEDTNQIQSLEPLDVQVLFSIKLYDEESK